MRRLILALLGFLALVPGPAFAVSDSPQYQKPYCLYKSADPTLTDSEVYPFRCGSDGILKVMMAGGTPATGSATATNQTAVQATPGSDATKAVAIQGVTGGKAIPVTSSASATTNDASTITTGGTFQTIIAANSSRKSVDFQNKCNLSGNCTATTNNCHLFFGSASATAAASILVAPGQEYLRTSGAVPSDAVKATCDGTGDKFYAAEQ